MSDPFDDEEGTPDPEEAALDALGDRFLTAMKLKDDGKLEKAEEILRAIIAVEPRLAEPRIELARILLDTERIPEAEDHAREGLEQLETSGVWTAEIPPNIVKGVAHALIAEILRRRADDDDVIFGDPAAWKALLDEAKQHFEKAAELDPSDEYASFHAFFLGMPGKKVDFGDGLDEDEPE
jgi:tetratricopeptide (TPR) repeat protein